MNNCYTTLLSSDNYVFGVITQFFILKQFGTQEDYICIISDNLKKNTYKLLDQVGIKYIKYPSELIYKYGDLPNYDTTINKFRGFEFKQYDKIMFLDADLIPLENLDYLFNKKIPLLCMGGSGLPSGGLFVYDPKSHEFNQLVEKYQYLCWNDEQQLSMMWYMETMWSDNWVTIDGPAVNNNKIKAFHWGGGPRYWDLFKINSIKAAKTFSEITELKHYIYKGYGCEEYE